MKINWKSWLALAIAPALMLMGVASARADYGGVEAAPVASPIQGTIMARLDALERLVQKGHGGPKDGADGWKDVSSEKWKSKFGGRIQFDYWMAADVDEHDARGINFVDYVEARRLRIFMSGEGYGVYEYKLQLDFAPENNEIEYKDMYVGIKELPALHHLRFGHFKAQYGLEELTSSKYITFMERSLPTGVFAPSRQLGMGFYRARDDDSVLVQGGIYWDTRDFDVDHEIIDRNQGTLLVGRAVATPYYCEDGRHFVHVGAGAYWLDSAEDSVRFRARPEVHEGDRFIDSGTIAADDYWSYNLEAAVVWGQFSAQAEYFYADVDDTDQSFHGAYVYASYFLTGESRAYKRSSGSFDRVKPLTNFWIVRDLNCDHCIGWGAWEVVARWSYLDLTDGLGGNAGELNNYTLGVNWYWNPNVRMMFNYIRTDGDYNAGPDAESDLVGMALRWDF